MTCNCSPLFLYQDFISHIPVKPASSVKCFQKTHQDRYGTHQLVAKVALIKESKWKLSVSLTHCTDAPTPTSETWGRASTSCSPDIQIRSRWQGKKMNRILNWLYFIIWYWLETTRKLFAMSIVPFPEVKHNIWNEAIKSPLKRKRGGGGRRKKGEDVGLCGADSARQPCSDEQKKCLCKLLPTWEVGGAIGELWHRSCLGLALKLCRDRCVLKNFEARR